MKEYPGGEVQRLFDAMLRDVVEPKMALRLAASLVAVNAGVAVIVLCVVTGNWLAAILAAAAASCAAHDFLWRCRTYYVIRSDRLQREAAARFRRRE